MQFTLNIHTTAAARLIEVLKSIEETAAENARQMEPGERQREAARDASIFQQVWLQLEGIAETGEDWAPDWRQPFDEDLERRIDEERSEQLRLREERDDAAMFVVEDELVYDPESNTLHPAGWDPRA